MATAVETAKVQPEKMEVLSITLPRSLRALIEDEAAENYSNVSAEIRRACAAYFKKDDS